MQILCLLEGANKETCFSMDGLANGKLILMMITMMDGLSLHNSSQWSSGSAYTFIWLDFLKIAMFSIEFPCQDKVFPLLGTF